MKHVGHEGSHSVIFSVCVMTDASSACSYTIGKWASLQASCHKNILHCSLFNMRLPLFVMANSLSIQIHASKYQFYRTDVTEI